MLEPLVSKKINNLDVVLHPKIVYASSKVVGNKVATMRKPMSWSSSARAFLLVLAIFYFSYHLISGDKGVIAWMKLENEVKTAKLEQEESSTQRLALKQRVEGLYAHSLDVDLLDEQARKILGQAKSTEILYLTPVD